MSRGTATIGTYNPAVPVLPSGLQAWYDDRFAITVDANGRVSQWNDLSGNGFHATQTTASVRPLRDASNGGRVRFDHARADFLTIPTTLTSNPQNLSVFGFVEPDTVAQPQNNQFVGLGGGGGTDNAVSVGTGFNTGEMLIFENGGPTSFSGAVPAFPALWGIVSSSTSRRAYLNSITGITAPLAPSNTARQGGVIGNMFNNGNNGWGFSGNLRSLYVFDHALTAAEMTKLVTYTDTLLRTPSGSSIAGARAMNIVCSGDSITYGLGSGTLDSWPMYLARHYPGARVTNLGVPGRTLANIAANAAAEIDALLQPGKYNVLFLWAGTNDTQAGATAASVYSSYQSCVAARFAAGWSYVVVMGILPRIGGTTATNNAFNTLMDSGANTWASAYVPLHKDPRMSDGNNTAFYADGTHPTASGNRVALEYFIQAVSAGLPQVSPANIRSTIDREDGTAGTLVVPAAANVVAPNVFDNGTIGLAPDLSIVANAVATVSGKLGGFTGTGTDNVKSQLDRLAGPRVL